MKLQSFNLKDILKDLGILCKGVFMNNTIKFILPQNLGWRLGSDSYL